RGSATLASFVCAPPRTGRVRDPRISIFNIFDGGLLVRPCIESPAPEEQEGRGWMVRGVAFLRPMTSERCAARLAMVRWKPDLASGRETHQTRFRGVLALMRMIITGLVAETGPDRTFLAAAPCAKSPGC